MMPSFLTSFWFWVIGIIILLSLIALGYWIYDRYYWRWYQRRWYHSPRIKQARYIINELYQHVDGYQISKQQRAEQNMHRYEMVYGEISFYTLAAILEKIQPAENAIFYDLGSGTGKAVIMAALLHPFQKICGIEYLSKLYECSQQRLQALRERADLPQHCYPERIQLIHGDFLQMDISDANIVYINATGFFGSAKQALVEQLLNVKTGCWIIINSKTLPEENFQMIDATFWPMSWGNSLIYVYRRCELN